MNKINQKIIVGGNSLLALTILLAASSAFAAENGKSNVGRNFRANPPAVVGTVVGSNNTSLTVTGRDRKTYIVDASLAAVFKPTSSGNATSSVSTILSGDTVAVFGTLSGNSVTATRIIDGAMPAMPIKVTGKKGNGGEKPEGTNSAGKMMGKKPGVTDNRLMGSVTAINGTSFTLTTKGRTVKTITVNDASATFTKDGQASTLGSLAVGENVTVQGTMDAAGTTFTATKVNIVTPSIRFAGTVQSVSGSSLTVLASNGTTYTVDAASAKVNYAKGKKGTISAIQVSDKVSVSGKLTPGTNNVLASMIRDTSRTQ